MDKKEISTSKAPKAAGPYSQGFLQGSWLFISGQIPIEPSTGKLIQDSIEKEAEQAFENLQAVVVAAGGNMGKVVKVTLFLTEMQFYSQVNEVYARYFTPPFPARSCLAVKGLPKGARIEVEAIAHLG